MNIKYIIIISTEWLGKIGLDLIIDLFQNME